MRTNTMNNGVARLDYAVRAVGFDGEEYDMESAKDHRRKMSVAEVEEIVRGYLERIGLMRFVGEKDEPTTKPAMPVSLADIDAMIREIDRRYEWHERTFVETHLADDRAAVRRLFDRYGIPHE